MKQKRWAIKLALCLLAGAVVTWGVAWGCALWGPIAGVPHYSIGQVGGWPLAAPAQWPEPDAFGSSRTWAIERTEWFNEQHNAIWRMSLFDVGWPTRSFRTRWIYHSKLKPWLITEELTGWKVPKSLRRSTAQTLQEKALNRLPTEVLPLGFTFNTLLAAGVLLGVLETFAFARCRARRHKGRCPSCGYDRGGLAEGAACPECGHS